MTEDEKLKMYQLFIERNMEEKKIWKLLYRRSEDGDAPEICHKNCENNANILWIIHSETNNVFGGFTTRTWISNSGYLQDDHAFLYSLRSNKDYPAQSFGVKSNKSQYAVSFKSYRLCAFGKYDLGVARKKGLNSKTGSSAYNTPSKGYLNGDEWIFRPLEVEIFSCS